MNFVLPSLGVVAVTELYQRVLAKDWKSVAVIAVAAVVGFVAGVFGLAGLDPVTGFTAGLAAVGVHTVGQAVSGK